MKFIKNFIHKIFIKNRRVINSNTIKNDKKGISIPIVNEDGSKAEVKPVEGKSNEVEINGKSYVFFCGGAGGTNEMGNGGTGGNGVTTSTINVHSIAFHKYIDICTTSIEKAMSNNFKTTRVCIDGLSENERIELGKEIKDSCPYIKSFHFKKFIYAGNKTRIYIIFKFNMDEEGNYKERD